MLNRHAMCAVVAAVLCSVAVSDHSLAQPFATGDFDIYPQDSWGETPTPTNAAGLLLNNYDSVYDSSLGLVEVGIPGPGGFSMLFTNVASVLVYLPANGAIGTLTSDRLDPSSTTSGLFGGEVLALRFNIDFSDAGITLGNLGIPFGDLELHSLSTLPLLNDLSVRQFSAEVNSLLGGGTSVYGIAQLFPIANELNTTFGTSVSLFARDHLRLPTFTDGDYITHTQASWGDEIPTPTNGAGLLLANFDTVYADTGGVLSVGRFGPIHYAMQFDNVGSLLGYLPAFGLDGRLLADYLNPLTTNAGGFGGEVSALKLNIDFADAGLTLGTSGSAFGDLELQGLTEANQTQFNGFSVRDFFASANFSIGTAVAADVSHFNAITEQLNAAFAEGSVTPWARTHLRLAGIPGDYNQNGIVDAADYTVWRDTLSAGATSLTNDPTPGVVDESDYMYWRSHFGDTLGSGAGAGGAAAVPEPATLVLLMFAAAGWGLRRRRAA
jgi:PEP-CTERM motif